MPTQAVAKPSITRAFGSTCMSFRGNEQCSRTDEDWQTWAEKDDSGIISVLVNLPTPDAEGRDPPPAPSFMVTSHPPTAGDTLVIPFGAHSDSSMTFLSLLDAAHTAQVLCQEAELDQDAVASVTTVVVEGRVIPAVNNEDYSATYDDRGCKLMRGRALSDIAIFANLTGTSLHVEADPLGAVDMAMASNGAPSLMTWKGSDFDGPEWLPGELPHSVKHSYSLDLRALCRRRDLASLVSEFKQFLTKQVTLVRSVSKQGKQADILLDLHTDPSDRVANEIFGEVNFQRLYDVFFSQSSGDSGDPVGVWGRDDGS